MGLPSIRLDCNDVEVVTKALRSHGFHVQIHKLAEEIEHPLPLEYRITIERLGEWINALLTRRDTDRFAILTFFPFEKGASVELYDQVSCALRSLTADSEH